MAGVKKQMKNRPETGKDGIELWRKITEGVVPYAPEKMPARKKPARTPPSKPEPAARNPATATIETRLDNAIEKRLKKGTLPIEGRIDLHGMTQDEALRALERFVMRCAAADKRTLLVITGKGRAGEGVLKRALPFWLERPGMKKLVLSCSPALQKDGGGGAFYLRLRKKRG